MGLKNAPEFEAMSETDTGNETTTTKEQTVNTTTKTQDSAAAATTAIAQAAASANTAVSAARAPTKLVLAFSDKQAVFDISTVESLGLALPRIKGEQGSLFKGDVDLGDKIHFEIVSISQRWVVGTGEDDKEAKDYFRVSFDNRTISGEPNVNVDDYLQSLLARGFENASKSEYLDVFGFLTWSAKGGDIAPDARELMCLQCSPTSRGAFVAFATTRGLLESRGLAKPIDIVEVHAEKRTSGSNKYTNFSFHVPK